MEMEINQLEAGRHAFRLDHRQEADFADRRDKLLEMILRNPIPEWDRSRQRMYHAIVRLGMGREVDIALADLNASNDNPGHDAMFFRHANIDAWLRFGNAYSPELAAAVKQRMCESGHYQMEGGTENHKLMNAVAGYLSAQCWPDWPDAASVKERCFTYLQRYFQRVSRYGQGEFDSPTYSVFYLNTLATLYDFAADPKLVRQAEMMLDWFLANAAGEWLNGSFIGAHSRDYHPTDTHNDAAAGITVNWLYFGGRMPCTGEKSEPHYSVINALSGYRPLAALVRIAQDRSTPYVHRESHDLSPAGDETHDGHETERIGPNLSQQGYGYISRSGVRKYTYVDQGYGLGSMIDGRQGDIIWSGQMRRWSLDWDSPATQAVLFFTHPCPDFGHVFEAYAEKWQGSSPYEQVMQDEGALLAVYRIPEGETYRYKPRNPFQSDKDSYIDGFFPEEALLMLEEHNGWIFGHGGSVLVAVHVLTPWFWQESAPGNRRLRCPGHQMGVILQTANPASFRENSDAALSAEENLSLELERFSAAILRETTVDSAFTFDQSVLAYTALNGNRLSLTYDGPRTINGVPLNPASWPLIDSPFFQSEVGSGVLHIGYGQDKYVLDYNTWTIRQASQEENDDADH